MSDRAAPFSLLPRAAAHMGPLAKIFALLLVAVLVLTAPAEVRDPMPSTHRRPIPRTRHPIPATTLTETSESNKTLTFRP